MRLLFEKSGIDQSDHRPNIEQLGDALLNDRGPQNAFPTGAMANGDGLVDHVDDPIHDDAHAAPTLGVDDHLNGVGDSGPIRMV